LVAAGAYARARILRRAKAFVPTGRWLVVAPHQDDETLGAGGLIAFLAASGEPARVAYLTDGGGSHPDSPTWSSSRVALQRRREADNAVERLGGRRSDIVQLGWQDGHPFAPGTPPFDATVDHLLGICRREQIRKIATTWRGEGHADHYAAFRVAVDVVRRSLWRISLFEYVVWGWTYPELARIVRDYDAFAFPTALQAPRLRHAIGCHRTQTSRVIGDSREGFRLPPIMTALAGRQHEILLQERRWMPAP
jgi:LmbE family N-acetylglucosaminyl deacetylase